MDDKRSSRRSFLASFPPQVSFLWSSMCPSLKVVGHHFPPCGMVRSKCIDTTSTVESSQPSSTLTCQSSSSKSSCTNRHVSRSRSVSSSKEGSSFRSVISIIVLFLILLPEPGSGCGPGRGGNRRRSPRKLTPLVFMQHVPNVSENTITASGVSNERDSPRITRDHPKFKELVPNYNPDIIFKDEEGTGADRLMTRRLKEKLNTLAISVMNQWPGVKLRVTEGWDQDGHHAANSLHYQGRAVDITTSDRDRSKYGMLARLAVEAGFDWVYYESRYHIHCSVKQERTDDHRAGGCFDATSQVTTPTGLVPMSEVKVGDEVLALDSNGVPVFTPVLLFLDRDSNASRMYHQITTRSGRRITLTGSHLIFVIDFLTSDFNVTLESRREVFARQVIPGQFVSLVTPEGGITFDKVVDVSIIGKKGVYAPLTSEGNLIVNEVLASCYANINDQSLAHLAFFPLRAFDNLKECFNYVFGGSSSGVISDSSGVISDSSGVISNSINSVDNRLMERKRRKGKNEKLSNGIHWYPRLLQSIADQILPYHYLD